jgi:hypothetical protein
LGHGESAIGYPSIRRDPFFADVDWEHLNEVQIRLFTRIEEEDPRNPFPESEKVVRKEKFKDHECSPRMYIRVIILNLCSPTRSVRSFSM